MEKQTGGKAFYRKKTVTQDDPDRCPYKMLYHYTSLEQLALILKNRAIRLSPLDAMDDLQEKKTADIPNLGKFIFISAWTSEKKESIPMWKMYSNTKAGVRVGLPVNPFSRNKITAEDIAKAGFQRNPEDGKMEDIECFLNPVEMLSEGYLTRQAFADSILVQVQYTDDIDLLEPKTETLLEGMEIGNFSPLGRCKNKYWAFQKEWRYLLEFVPMKLDSPDIMQMEYRSTMERMLLGIEKPPFPFYTLPIDPEAFSKMEIVMSPHLTEGNQVLLETLVQQYNPEAKVKKSELLDLI